MITITITITIIIINRRKNKKKKKNPLSLFLFLNCNSFHFLFFFIYFFLFLSSFFLETITIENFEQCLLASSVTLACAVVLLVDSSLDAAAARLPRSVARSSAANWVSMTWRGESSTALSRLNESRLGDAAGEPSDASRTFDSLDEIEIELD